MDHERPHVVVDDGARHAQQEWEKKHPHPVPAPEPTVRFSPAAKRRALGLIVPPTET